MDKKQADEIITQYVKKIYGFSVSKLNKISEAEELASKIVLEVYLTLLRKEDIVNLNGYIYKIAQNVFVNYISDRYKSISVDGIERLPYEKDLEEELFKEESYGIIRREISYLSKSQRQIIVLFYFHDKKIREIAQMLSLPENTVKWHLACSRKELKAGMDKIRTIGKLGTDPIKFTGMGHSGQPGEKGDTKEFLSKSLTQNIAYAAYHKTLSVNEIAEELGVNPVFVSDEVDTLEEYGFMDKLPSGKYRTNIYIKELQSEERDSELNKLNEIYPKLFAEKFIKPVLESIKEIPQYLYVPENDINLYRWSVLCFLCHKLKTAEISDKKFSVKRKDGGDFVAITMVATREQSEIEANDNDYLWWCGDMWRRPFKDDWISWQFNCYWTNREGDWRNNNTSDYAKLNLFLKGNLPETKSNIEDYQRLLDKGYLVKDKGEYKCNIIVCHNEKQWHSSIPEASDEIKTLSKEYAEKSAAAHLINQPAHMHDLIKYYQQNAACSLHTRIMKELVDTGVLAEPTPVQKKGLLTVMFLTD